MTRREFDPYDGQLKRITTGIEGQGNLLRDLHYQYDKLNSVTARDDRIMGTSDRYRYDSFDRIIGMQRTQTTAKTAAKPTNTTSTAT